jgi:hypothetical protein
MGGWLPMPFYRVDAWRAARSHRLRVHNLYHPAACEGKKGYSHSIVAGGLLLMSYTVGDKGVGSL